MNSNSKSIKRITRFGAAALVAVAVCGVGAGVASAAPSDEPGGALPMTQVTNLTPYTWTWYRDTMPTTTYPVNPPKTVAPGQTATWSDPEEHGVSFEFKDDRGVVHAASIVKAVTYITDAEYLDTQINQYRPDTNFHFSNDPDGNAYHFDALWNSPVSVTIDNNTDAADAAAAVNYQFPRAVQGSVKWTPNPDAKVSFKWNDGERATSRVYNHSDADATLITGNETSKGESTSLGEEASVSISSKVFGVAAKAAITASSDQEWGSSDSLDVEREMEVGPGRVGWIDKRLDVGSLEGELVFTSPEGVTFDLKNVAISKGDLVNPNGQLPSGHDFSSDGASIGAQSASDDVATGVKVGAATSLTGSDKVQAANAVALADERGNVVVIDSTKQPDEAKAAMDLYGKATDRSFLPTADPTYSQTAWGPILDENKQPVGSVTGTEKGGQMKQKLMFVHTQQSSWSLGGSVETSAGFDLAEAIDAEMSVKLSASHKWESETSDKTGIWVTANPGKTVWVEVASTMGSYTGDFAFTADGVRYVVKNVTITQPAAPDADSSASTVYRVLQLNSGTIKATKAGVTPMNQLPLLQKYIAEGH